MQPVCAPDSCLRGNDKERSLPQAGVLAIMWSLASPEPSCSKSGSEGFQGRSVERWC
jgi:hypothetical protein